MALTGKSPLARVWKLVYRTNEMEDFAEDQLHDLVWMPAHGSAGSIGTATTSNGEKVGPVQWRANRLVDLLAKSAARALRAHEKVRRLIQVASHALEYSLAKLGAVTYAANNFKTPVLLPDGTYTNVTLRDSAGIKAIRTGTNGGKRKRAQDTMEQRNVVRKTLCIPINIDSGASNAHSVAKRRKVACKIKQAALDHEADCEMRFMENWRENLPPLLPTSSRPASARMADLRARIAAKTLPVCIP